MTRCCLELRPSYPRGAATSPALLNGGCSKRVGALLKSRGSDFLKVSKPDKDAESVPRITAENNVIRDKLSHGDKVAYRPTGPEFDTEREQSPM